MVVMCVTLGRLAALCARSRRRRLARGLGAWRRRWEALHRGAAPALGRWWKARVADVEGPAAAADVAADPAPPPRRAPAYTLLVCAHAVYIPSAALFVAEALGTSRAGVDAILDCNTQEAEGYLITHAGDVSLLTRGRP